MASTRMIVDVIKTVHNLSDSTNVNDPFIYVPTNLQPFAAFMLTHAMIRVLELPFKSGVLIKSWRWDPLPFRIQHWRRAYASTNSLLIRPSRQCRHWVSYLSLWRIRMCLFIWATKDLEGFNEIHGHFRNHHLVISLVDASIGTVHSSTSVTSDSGERAIQNIFCFVEWQTH